MREPRSDPLALNVNANIGVAQQGLGRGRRIPDPSAGPSLGRGCVPARDGTVGIISQSRDSATRQARELENAQKPYNDYEVINYMFLISSSYIIHCQ